MRPKWLVPLVSVALLSCVCDAAMAQSRPLLVPKCTISGITANSVTGKVTANGSCKIRRKYKVPIVWKHSYTAYDSEGHLCGSARTGKVRAFILKPPGSHKVTVRFTLNAKLRKDLKRVKPVTKTKSLVLGGQMAQCGRLGEVPIPPPEVMCQWSETYFGGSRCGAATPGVTVAWSSPITLVDGLISAGNIVSETSGCWLEPLLNFPTYEWLGFTQHTHRLMCNDRKVYELQMWYLTMVNPLGETCGPWRPPVVNIASFRIPTTWGGEIRVMWQVGGGSGRNTTTASFRLSGTENGCPLMMSAGRPWP